MIRLMLFGVALLTTPVCAQDLAQPVDGDYPRAVRQDETPPVLSQSDRAGRVSSPSVGRVGQRYTREQTAPHARPLGRIASRIQNRVQSRIRSRLDRYYDPQANAATPFEVAGQQTKRGSLPQR